MSGFLELINIAGGRALWGSLAFGINIRCKKNRLAVRGPQFPARLSSDKRELMKFTDGSRRAIEIGNPNL
jgi:hypothetical protein